VGTNQATSPGPPPASVFLSHSHLDKAIARQIYLELTRHSFVCWFDEAELRPGDSLIQRIEAAIDSVDYLIVLLSRASVTSAWVQKELRSVLVEEIALGRIRVIPVQIGDCDVPRFLKDKLCVDLRNDFSNKISELIAFLRGDKPRVYRPRQMVIAEFVRGASTGLWETLQDGDVAQSEMEDLVRQMTDKEIDAAVAICHWDGDVYKQWENSLIQSICDETRVSVSEARRLLRRMEDLGFIAKATDLDYSRGEKAYTQEAPLWVFKRAAQQTGPFESLGAPEPYSLSQFLGYDKPVLIHSSKGWSAGKFVTAELVEGSSIFAVVTREQPPEAWIFSSASDRSPRHAAETWHEDPLFLRPETRYLPVELREFDDVGVLIT
jgi:TIR domain